jgi:heat shock protein HtpX
VLLHEARRRNRRRIAVLAALAAVNLWAVGTALALVASWFFTKRSMLESLAIDGPLIAVVTVGYVWWQVHQAGRAAIGELGAVELEPGEWPRTFHVIEEVGIASGAGPVRVAVIEDDVPNALTVGAGTRSTVLIITRGLVQHLSRDELEAVVAVQACSVARLDVALQTVVVACAAGTFAIPGFVRDYVADVWYPTIMRWFTWPSRLAAAVLRRRALRDADFGADEMAVAITRHPAALRSALAKVLADPRVVGAVTPANAPLWFEPVPEGETDRARGLAKHSMAPSLEDRIAHLPPV